MAAHLEGKGISALDMTGMSQKNGAVTSHVRIAPRPEDIRAQRIATGEADLILGCDMLTAGAHDAISKTRPGRTVAVINTYQQPPGQFARQPDWQFPAEQIRALIDESVGGRSHFLDATRLATALMGDSIATNLFMLGYAFQKGLIPLRETSLMQAIELNGVAVDGEQASLPLGTARGGGPEPGREDREPWPAGGRADAARSGCSHRATRCVPDRVSGCRATPSATRSWSSRCAAPRRS